MTEQLRKKLLRHTSLETLDSFGHSILYIAPYLRQHSSEPVLTAEQISKFTYKSIRDKQYHSFDIPKKSGGARTITAPNEKLKTLQRCIAFILSANFDVSDNVHGFTEGRSVVTNASCHLHRRYVLNIDLKDFFPSITEKRVRQVLLDKGIHWKVSEFITRLCTYHSDDADMSIDVLPQGAPTSPILSNLVCRKMDIRLAGLASRFGLKYTRYADDITFSSNHSVYSKDSEFWTELRKIVSENGFTINESKTRLLKQGSRQEVTGITVGNQMNVSRKWIKKLRAQIFQMEMFGCSKEEYRSAMGKLSFLKMVCGENERYFKLHARARRCKYAIPFLEDHWYPEYRKLNVPIDVNLDSVYPIDYFGTDQIF